MLDALQLQLISEFDLIVLDDFWSSKIESDDDYLILGELFDEDE